MEQAWGAGHRGGETPRCQQGWCREASGVRGCLRLFRGVEGCGAAQGGMGSGPWESGASVTPCVLLSLRAGRHPPSRHRIHVYFVSAKEKASQTPAGERALLFPPAHPACPRHRQLSLSDASHDQQWESLRTTGWIPLDTSEREPGGLQLGSWEASTNLTQLHAPPHQEPRQAQSPTFWPLLPSGGVSPVLPSVGRRRPGSPAARSPLRPTAPPTHGYSEGPRIVKKTRTPAFPGLTEQPCRRPLGLRVSQARTDQTAPGPTCQTPRCAQTPRPALIKASWEGVGANTHRPSGEPGAGRDGLSGRLMHLYSDQGKRKWGGGGRRVPGLRCIRHPHGQTQPARILTRSRAPEPRRE